MATAEIWRCLMENDNNNTAAAAAAPTGVDSTSTTLSSSVGESNGRAVSLRRRRMEIRRIKMLSSHVGASSSSFVEQPVSKRLRPVTLREDGMEDEKLLNRGADNACSVECLGQGSITTTTTTTITTASPAKQSRLILSVFSQDDDDDDGIVVGERAASSSSSLSSACERVPSGGVCRLGEENECARNASDVVGKDRMSSGGSTHNNIMLEDSDVYSTLTSVGGFQSTLGNANIVHMALESSQAPGEEPRQQLEEVAPTALATEPESSGGPAGMSTSTTDTVTIRHAENPQHLEAMVTGAAALTSSSLWQQRPVSNDGIPDSSAVATSEAGGSGVPASCFASNDCPPHGMVSLCGRRREMEDAVVSQDSFVSLPCSKVGGCDAAGLETAPLHYFGVYDGHGGSQAANFCAQRLHQALAEEVESCFVQGQNVDQNAADWESKWLTTMTQCFKRMDAEVGGFCLEEGECPASDNPRCCPEPIAPETVGTTAIVAVVGACQIIVGNCGDSRAVLSRGGVAIPLSVDHKPEREDEMARVEAAGGRVIYWNGYRVLGVLAMSRAIGDRYLKPYVIAEPEVKCIKRAANDECLILASDGLWDVMSNEAVCDIARRALNCRRNGQPLPDGLPGATSDDESPAAAAAALLVKLALAKGSGDNISVVVVDLKAARSHR